MVGLRRALLALVLLQHSRRHARVGPDGELVLLPDQDRARWHHDEVAEAVAWLLSDAASYCVASIVTVSAGR